MPKCIDLAGLKFGKLTVLHRVEDKGGLNRGQRRLWLCKCECGNETVVTTSNLRSGGTKSCGCLRKEAVYKSNGTHHCTGERLHNIWRGIKARCYIPSCSNYKYYGGRGIEMCEEWKKDFEVFKKWAMSHGYSESLTIDRIDSDGNYSPENCRWVTLKENCWNRDLKKRKNNSSGYTGVQWRKDSQCWRAVIKVNGRTINLGSFITKEDAITARKEAEEKYWN